MKRTRARTITRWQPENRRRQPKPVSALAMVATIVCGLAIGFALQSCHQRPSMRVTVEPRAWITEPAETTFSL